MKKILFTSATCGPCFGLKKRIETEKLTVDTLEHNDENRTEFEKYGIRAVPRLVLEDCHGAFVVIQGSDDIIKGIKADVIDK